MINITRLHHVSICVRDMEASRHFYVDILGMEEVKRPDTFQFPGQWFRKNGYEIHTISAEVSGQIPGDV
jgi:glyoxylase I family protein